MSLKKKLIEKKTTNRDTINFCDTKKTRIINAKIID